MTDILELIDNALTDWRMSEDAMRWTPDAEAEVSAPSDLVTPSNTTTRTFWINESNDWVLGNYEHRVYSNVEIHGVSERWVPINRVWIDDVEVTDMLMAPYGAIFEWSPRAAEDV